jgi:predicted DNA-binding protein with PD1-like motif
MKYSEAKQGRVFVIRLEDGDIIHESIEKFAAEHSIKAAALIAVGGIDAGSRIVVGPKEGRAEEIEPVFHDIEDAHEVAGTGTLFPDDEGKPSLHMHIACGRGTSTETGCIRPGVKVWHILEVILTELTACKARRLPSPVFAGKFKLLEP